MLSQIKGSLYAFTTNNLPSFIPMIVAPLIDMLIDHPLAAPCLLSMKKQTMALTAFLASIENSLYLDPSINITINCHSEFLSKLVLAIFH